MARLLDRLNKRFRQKSDKVDDVQKELERVFFTPSAKKHTEEKPKINEPKIFMIRFPF